MAKIITTSDLRHIVCGRVNDMLMHYPIIRNFGYETINEALITSYNMKSCEKDLKRRFPEVISISDEMSNPYSNLPFYKNDKSGSGSFKIKLSDISNIKKIADVIKESYGWFIICIKVNELSFIDWDNNGKYICETEDSRYYKKPLELYCRYQHPSSFYIWIEAKFTIETKPHKLFHLTDVSNLKRISKQGLVPRSLGNFPSRIYFGESSDDIYEMMYGRYENPVMLRIDMSKLPESIKFYIYPRKENAVFTYDNISPDCIYFEINKKFKSISNSDISNIAVFENKFSTEEKRDVIGKLIDAGLELFHPKSNTFKKTLNYLDYSLNVLPGRSDVKDGFGTDVTQCNSKNKCIDAAGNYLKKEKGFDNFKDSMCWTIHELFHAWIESDFKGLTDTSLKKEILCNA